MDASAKIQERLRACLGVLSLACGVALRGSIQLMFGLGVTGMSNATSWGLYITMFMFFVGLSAGGLIVASSASVFHVATSTSRWRCRRSSCPRCASAARACSCSSTWAASNACGAS